MSALTKKRPTSRGRVEIMLSEGSPRLFVGPRSQLPKIRSMFKKMDFKAAEEGISWRELDKEEIKKFGEAALMLRGARKKEELTQVQLANILGTSQGNIALMENGSRPIGKTMAKRLEKILKVDYRVFL